MEATHSKKRMAQEMLKKIKNILAGSKDNLSHLKDFLDEYGEKSEKINKILFHLKMAIKEFGGFFLTRRRQ